MTDAQRKRLFSKTDEGIISALVNLHEQSIRERTHYYTGSVVQRAIAEICLLRQMISDLTRDEK